MKATYESQGSYSYLVYELDSEDILDSMSLGMITNNKITGLIPVVYTQMNNKRYIKYNITAKVSIRQFFEGIVNRKQVLSIFLGIVSTLQAAEEYMIDVGSFVMDMDYIYTDVTVYGASMICLPIEDEKKPLVEFRDFFKNIVFSAKFSQEEDSSYVGKIINYLSSTAGFSLEDFRNLLEELNMEKKETGMVHGGMCDMNTQTPEPTTVLSQDVPTVRNDICVQNQGNSTGYGTMSVQDGKLSQPILPYSNVQMGNQTQVSPQMAETPPVNLELQNPPTPKEEDKISLMKLLTHYNKDNVQLYKEQQKRKKEEKVWEKQAPDKKNNKESKKSSKKNKKAEKHVTDFAVPGQTGINAGQMERSGTGTQPDLTIMTQPSISSKAMTSMSYTERQPMAPGNMSQSPIAQSMTSSMPKQSVIQPSAAGSLPQGGGISPGSGIGKPNFGETTVLGAGNMGETTVLNTAMKAAANRMPFLVRVKNGVAIAIDKPVFRIGKEKNYVDYFISDNTAISRSHANIVIREGRYWVVDTNSTNHTYVNERMIASNTETEIVNGSRIKFADEEFEFKIM